MANDNRYTVPGSMYPTGSDEFIADATDKRNDIDYTGKGSAEDLLAPPALTKDPVPVGAKVIAINQILGDPAFIKVGTTVEVQCIFDRDVPKVLNPANRLTASFSAADKFGTIQGPLRADTKSAIFRLTAIATGTTNFKVEYTDESGIKSDVTLAMTVVAADATEVLYATATPATVNEGAEVSVKIAVSKALSVVGDVTLTPSAGLTVKTPATLQPDGKTIFVIYTATTPGTQTVKAAVGPSNKTANIVVLEVPAVLQTATGEVDTVEVGSDLKVTATFDKAPKLEDVSFVFSSEFTQKTAPAISGKTVVATYTAVNAGNGTVTVSHKGVTINVGCEVTTPSIGG